MSDTEPTDLSSSEQSSRNPSLLRHSIIYVASDISIKVIGFLLIPLYAHLLSPTQYGIVGVTNAIIQILSPIVGLSLASCIPILYHGNTPEERKKLIGSVMTFMLIYGFFMASILTFLGRPLLKLTSINIPFFPYIPIAFWTIFFNCFFYIPLGVFNMEQKALPYMFYSVGIALTGILLNILLVAIFRLEALGLLLSGLITAITNMITALIVLRHLFTFKIYPKKLFEVFKLAIPNLPHAFSGTLLQHADRFFLSGLATLAATGYYSFSTTLSSTLLVITGGLTTALNPLFYRRAYNQDSRLPQDWAHYCSQIIFVMAFIGTSIAILSKEIVSILASDIYQPAAQIIPILLAGQMFMGLYWLATPGIGFTKKLWVHPVASYPAIMVNIALNLYLIPKFGPIGSAWAMVGGTATQWSIYSLFSQKYFHIPYELGVLAKIGLLTGITLIAARFMNNFNAWAEIAGKLCLLIIFPIYGLKSGLIPRHFISRKVFSIK